MTADRRRIAAAALAAVLVLSLVAVSVDVGRPTETTEEAYDAVAVKALVDVAHRGSVDWTSAERAAHRSSAVADDQDSSASSTSAGAPPSDSASMPWRS